MLLLYITTRQFIAAAGVWDIRWRRHLAILGEVVGADLADIPEQAVHGDDRVPPGALARLELEGLPEAPWGVYRLGDYRRLQGEYSGKIGGSHGEYKGITVRATIAFSVLRFCDKDTQTACVGAMPFYRDLLATARVSSFRLA